MWDNATYHSSEETRAVIKTLNLSLIFSGPYSYSAAPIELLFAGLKMGELNQSCKAPNWQKVSKLLNTKKFKLMLFYFRSLQNVGELVKDKLKEIPRSTRVSYWHRATLCLYGYVCLKNN